jgi:hypothetical protein
VERFSIALGSFCADIEESDERGDDGNDSPGCEKMASRELAHAADSFGKGLDRKAPNWQRLTTFT